MQRISIPLLVIALGTTFTPAIAQTDSTRPRTKTSADSAALAALVHDASERNRLPPDLVSYKATVETEIAAIIRREDATEIAATLEQVASTLRWTRAGTYEQKVTGYRAQQLGLTISMLSVFRVGWLRPTLYGNRLRMRSITEPDSAGPTRRASRRDEDTMPAIHPLATDRGRYYTFTGGDTLVTIKDGARRIPIVRVRVHPRPDITNRVLLFEGDLDLDATRGALVRMRGYFLRAGSARRSGLAARLFDAYAFVEYENAEHVGQFWLPTRQRIELQIASPMLTDGRYVVRIASRFPRIAVNDTTLDSASLLHADSLRLVAPRRLVYAPNDSIDRFEGWQFPLGAISSGLHADDFNDVAPDALRPFGKPRFSLSTQYSSDILRYNRVEGLFTGIGMKLALRDLAPGVVARANVGWAWSEQTARGKISVERTSEPWTIGVRAGRTLDLTNDFRAFVEPNPSALAIAGSLDTYDYVDRKAATLLASRHLLGTRARIRAEFGIADDRYVPATLKRGPFGGSAYRANRGVDNGSYRRTSVLAEWHPAVSEEDARPGYTARMYYQRGDGTLTFQRIEGRLIGREIKGPFTLLGRMDAGAVSGNRIPSQQLFELGRGRNLAGSDTNYAGSRAGIVGATLMYATPFLRQPLRISGSLMLPGIAPGLSVGLIGGWTSAPTQAARDAILRLGVETDSLGVVSPLATVTGRFRSTVAVGLRFFSGSVFAGFARPVDHKGPWRLEISAGN